MNQTAERETVAAANRATHHEYKAAQLAVHLDQLIQAVEEYATHPNTSRAYLAAAARRADTERTQLQRPEPQPRKVNGVTFCEYCQEAPASGYVSAYRANVCNECYADHHGPII